MRNHLAITLVCFTLCSIGTFAQNNKAGAYTGPGSLSIGIGERIGNFSLTTVCATGARFVEGATGKVKAIDGSEWIVPMDVNRGAGAVDMYNNCNSSGDNPDYLDELETIVVDEDGEVITAHIFGDNYYELYINGQFVARDSISFIPFNSTAVRFKAKYPITVAVHMADWETHFGVGMEYGRFNVGDAGFIAHFDNGAITNAEWKVLPVYVAPLDNTECITENANGIADASACPIRPQCADKDPNTCQALHYKTPPNWKEPGFDDSIWLNASLYEADKVTRAPGYANYAKKFHNASFIWSPSLKLDNEVLARFVIQKPNN